MTAEILRHLGNEPDLDRADGYAAIIGDRPSQGARSPSLWNAAFAAEDVDARFLPFDVADAALAPLVEALRRDPRFLGGAVTMPHKAAIVERLDRVEPVAARIEAVNAIYRDGTALVGANTDGAAARAVLRARLGVERLGSRRVLLLGTGGAGTAIAAYVADDLDAGGSLVLCNRDRNKAERVAQRIGPGISCLDWPPPPGALADIDVLINCTSVGFAPAGTANALNTALSSAIEPAANFSASLAAVALPRRTALVFDVIYQPRVTMLMHIAAAHGIDTMGGLEMNLEQAVLAYVAAVPNADAARVRAAMAAVP